MVEVIGIQSDVLGPISIFHLTLYVSEVLLVNGTLEIPRDSINTQLATKTYHVNPTVFL